MAAECLDVGVLEVGELLESSRTSIVRPDVRRPVAIREEVDGAAQPDRIDVHAALVGQAGLRRVAQIHDGERRVLSTAVAAKFHVPARHAVDHDLFAVG